MDKRKLSKIKKPGSADSLPGFSYFSVKGQGSRVKGQGSRVKGQGSRVKGQGSRVKGQGSRVKGQEFLTNDK
ncbi:MAG: hypothetical protein ACFKPT_27150 [Gloeotrichia echinulata GP01]